MPDSRDRDDPRVEEFVRKAGAELESSLREGGSPLPAGVSGEQLVRSVIDDMHANLLSDATKERVQLWQPHIDRIIRELEVELPGGRSNPTFQATMVARISQWVHEHPDLAP